MRKKQIFTSLGSNFLLKDKELTMKLKNDLRYIKDSNKEEACVIRRLEPTNTRFDKAKNPPQVDLISIWSG